MDEKTEPIFYDAAFRQKRKKGKFRIVEPPVPKLEAPVADTHAHLAMLSDASLALARSAAHGVYFICCIADVCEETSEETYGKLENWQHAANGILHDFALSEQRPVPHVRVAIGCHPHNAKFYDNDAEERLLDFMRDPRTCAIGEVGLDYHYDHSSREAQREAFRRQIALAHRAQLPLILHIREAHEEAFRIMTEQGFPQAGTLLHCFNLDWEALEPWMNQGCYVAFGGAYTFSKSTATQQASLKVPSNRILTETDSPFMTPEPLRGMECGPEHTVFTAAKIAEVRRCAYGDSRARFLTEMYNNALSLLDREPTRWQKERAESEGDMS